MYIVTVVADVQFLQLCKVCNIGRQAYYPIVTQCQPPQLLQLIKRLQNIQKLLNQCSNHTLKHS